MAGYAWFNLGQLLVASSATRGRKGEKNVGLLSRTACTLPHYDATGVTRVCFFHGYQEQKREMYAVVRSKLHRR